ncbi:DinB family protein [Pedobacter xixiisoli]|uniref:DinB superfamily protein n=1 Tax=Pedobacter xixiisoli TaxID=1476464 RepID=A0A286ACV9_9SPHI|nr:DinB family protein [Pedobacter xixiisoli]SOD19728.1 DinB superfamily protein [Pedobacter xixiisoli]
MNIEKIYQSVLKTAEAYRQKLEGFDSENFQTEPPIGGWSYSEVYAHIFDSSLLSLMALNNCINGEGKVKPTAFVVKVILFFGSLPPGRKYKAPSKIAVRVKKISIAAAQQFITDFELQLAQTYPKMKDADPRMKVKHPVIGYLNTEQWLRFIEIHLNHHYKQLKRIENSFK